MDADKTSKNGIITFTLYKDNFLTLWKMNSAGERASSPENRLKYCNETLKYANETL